MEWPGPVWRRCQRCPSFPRTAMTERDLFLSALDINDRLARQAHLQAVCEGNSRLLRRVEAMLRAAEEDSDFLLTPVIEQLGAAGILELDAALIRGSGSTVTHQRTPEETALEVPGQGAQSSPVLAVIPAEFLQPSHRPDSVGLLSHYEILEKLGGGAFGTVCRALDTRLQRIVAIKVLLPELAQSADARERFLREARAAAAIRHEHVVSIYAVEEFPIPYLVMEYIPGQTLQQRLTEQPGLTIAEVLRIGRQISQALTAAHSRGLIHRDIKPGNILLEQGERECVKITDFGLACTIDETSRTEGGLIAGTPLYMAPEQALGRRVDYRADLFSLGSVLYQMLSGTTPFTGHTPLGVMKQVIASTPRPLGEVNSAIPRWLCDVVSRLHSKEPGQRYQSAAELAAVFSQQEAQSSLLAVNAGSPCDAPKPVATPRANRSGRSAIGWLAVALTVGLLITEALGVTHFAGSVIRLVRAQGTLVIEVADPDVSMLIDGEELAIRGTGIHEVRLQTGPHQLQVLKAGRRVQNEILQITRNGRQTVRVTLEPAQEGLSAGRPGGQDDASPNHPSAVDAAAWEQSVAGLPADELVKAVSLRLQRLNPGFDGVVVTTINEGVVEDLEMQTDRVTDLSPLKVLRGLKTLSISGSDAFSSQQVERRSHENDGGSQVKVRSVDRSRLSDLRPLEGLSLVRLLCFNTAVADLAPLRGMPLKELSCDVTRVADLAPLRDMPLEVLRFNHSRVADLAPLAGMKLRVLTMLNCPVRDLSALRGMALDQISLGRDVTDLSPLEGMPLVEIDGSLSQISDLSPLARSPLRMLSIGSTQVTDVTPLKSVKTLKRLWCCDLVSDLSPLAELPLEYLHAGPKVTDLAPLRNMPLNKLEFLSFQYERDAGILREITTLETINDLSAAAFWKSVEAPRPR